MAKPKKTLLELLKLLDKKKAMTKGEIIVALHTSRKTGWKICIEAEDKGLIEKDVFDRYTLTII